MITRQSAAGCKVLESEEGGDSSPSSEQERSAAPQRVPYRSLIYDANIGSLRFSRQSGARRGRGAAAAAYCISAGSPQHGTRSFRPLQPESKHSSLASKQKGNKTRAEHHIDADECSDVQSGDSSPTCVIGNATLCSSSTSPSLSSLSKASIDMDRAAAAAAADVYSVEVKELVSKNNCGSGGGLLSHLEGEVDSEPVFYSPSRNEMLLVKQGRGNKKLGLLDTPGRPGMKGGFGKRSEKETNNWASVHDALHLVDAANEVAFVTKNSLALRDAHSSKESQTAPFKSVQSPSMDHKSSEEVSKKKTGSGMSASAAGSRPSAQQQQQQQPGSVLNGTGSIFSFNSTHSVRGTPDAEAYDYDSSNFDKDSSASFDFNRAGAAHRAAGGPLLKPTPSKWDDAEKWLSASDQVPGSGSKPGSKSKGGPMQQQQQQQAHLVTNQGSVPVSTKKVTFSNLGAAGRQSASQNGGGGGAAASTAHLSKANNAVADNRGRDASSSSSSSSCENSGDAGDQLSEQPGSHVSYSGGRSKKLDGSAAKHMSNEGGSELIQGGVVAAAAAQAPPRFAFMPAAGTPMANGAVDRYPLNDLYGRDHGDAKEGSMSPVASTDDKSLKPALRTAKPTSESPTDYPDSPDRLKEAGNSNNPLRPGADSSVTAGCSLGVNTRGAVSTRDMGTEMTPIASVEPSRTATPVRATTPNLGSPINSRPSTPDRAIVPSSTPTSLLNTKTNNNNNNKKNSSSSSCNTGAGKLSSSKQESTDRRHSHDHCMMLQSTTGTTTSSSITATTTSTSKLLSSKELQAKTRQEILALGTQLGKANIAAWATKEEEEADAAKALKASAELEEVRKNLLASRAAAWEEAEQAKYAARYKREEAKIQAWENHEKAKAEAEMRRIEVKVERMWSHANEKLMNKLAAAHRRAEDLRAAAEALKSEQIAKAASRAEYIRGTGKMPTSFFTRFCQ